jgi:hypothetical protein
MNSSKPIIGVDVGGTLEYTWESKRIWFYERGVDLGKWPMSRDDVINVLGGNEGLYKEMHKDVYTDEAIFNRNPVPGACEAIRTLSKRFRIFLLSTRSKTQRAVTMKWLEKIGINQFIQDLIFIKHEVGRKLEWCKHTQAQVLIDDDMVHLLSNKPYDMVLKINFSNNPLTIRSTPPSIFLAQNWRHVLRIIDEHLGSSGICSQSGSSFSSFVILRETKNLWPIRRDSSFLSE